MAKTFGELILEYQNYEYSRENYELTKECSELQLMSQYLESQLFMISNVADIHEEFKEFDESYFIESISEDNLEFVCEAADEKSRNIFQKIWHGFKKLLKRFTNFFTKNSEKSEKTTEKAKEVKEVLNEIPDETLKVAIEGSSENTEDKKSDNSDNSTPTTDDKTNDSKDTSATNETPKTTKQIRTPSSGTLQSILKDAWKYENDGFVIATKQPFASKINNKIFRKKEYEYLKDMLAVALSDNTIIIKTTGNMKIMDIECICDTFDIISHAKYSGDNPDDPADDLRLCKKVINRSINKAMTKGISIKVDPNSIKRDRDYLNNIAAKMEKFVAESVDINNIFTEAKSNQKNENEKEITDLARNTKNVSNGISVMKEIYSDLIPIIGNVMKLYNDVEMYRSTVVNKLSRYLPAFIQQ